MAVWTPKLAVLRSEPPVLSRIRVIIGGCAGEALLRAWASIEPAADRLSTGCTTTFHEFRDGPDARCCRLWAVRCSPGTGPSAVPSVRVPGRVFA